MNGHRFYHSSRLFAERRPARLLADMSTLRVVAFFEFFPFFSCECEGIPHCAWFIRSTTSSTGRCRSGSMILLIFASLPITSFRRFGSDGRVASFLGGISRCITLVSTSGGVPTSSMCNSSVLRFHVVRFERNGELATFLFLLH